VGTSSRSGGTGLTFRWLASPACGIGPGPAQPPFGCRAVPRMRLPSAMHRQKMAALCGAAKFREETSKKADSATRGRIAAVQNVGGRIVRLQVIFCNAAFANAGHGGCSTGSHPHLHSRKFRERRPHPATKAGCCRFGRMIDDIDLTAASIPLNYA
jgi:hypothetical protein